MGFFGRIFGRLGRLEELYAIFLGVMDERTPPNARLIAILVMAYTLLPFDFIPELIPLAGIIDDLLIVGGGLAYADKLIPEAVMADARKKAASAAKATKRVIWAIVAFILVWIALTITVIVLAVRAWRG